MLFFGRAYGRHIIATLRRLETEIIIIIIIIITTIPYPLFPGQLERVRCTQQSAVKESLALQRALVAAEESQSQLVEQNESLAGRITQLEEDLRVSGQMIHALQARPAADECE